MTYAVRLPDDIANELVGEGLAQFVEAPTHRGGVMPAVVLIVYGVGANTVTIAGSVAIRSLAKKLHARRRSVRIEAQGPRGRMRLELDKAPDVDSLAEMLKSVLK